MDDVKYLAPRNLSCFRYLAGFVIGLLVLFWTTFTETNIFGDHLPNQHFQSKSPQAWRNIIQNCTIIQNSETLVKLVHTLEKWKDSSVPPVCRNFVMKLRSIFDIKIEHATLELKQSNMMMGILKSIKGIKDNPNLASKQVVIHLRNKWTGEENYINPLRAKRLKPTSAKKTKEYIQTVVTESAKSCDFCNYTKNTVQDIFGRLESNLSTTTSNMFKIDRFHSMVVFKTHHPHNWTKTMCLESFNKTLIWIQKANELDQRYKYPHIFWDILPRAGGSQIHPHIHMTLHRDSFSGLWNVWNKAAIKYATTYKSNNFMQNIIDIHKQLGLAVTHGNAVAFASLVAKHDNEIVVTSPEAGNSFFELTYYCLRAHIEEFQEYAISMSAIYPPLNVSSGMPAIFRIVTRGTVYSTQSDISSIDLFGPSNANMDPKDVAKKLKIFLEKQKL